MNEQTADVLPTDAISTVVHTPREGVEEWRHVVGYEGLYEVSSHGRVRRYANKRLLANCEVEDHYYKVFLSRPTGVVGVYDRKGYFVHRLVATAFIPNPEKKEQVDHIDTDRQNNIVSNLRWVTPYENVHNPISYSALKKSHQCGMSMAQVNALEIGRRSKHAVRCLETGIIYKSATEAEQLFGLQKGFVQETITAFTTDLFGAYLTEKYHFEQIDRPAPVLPDRRLLDWYLKHGVVDVDTGEFWLSARYAEDETGVDRSRIGKRCRQFRDTGKWRIQFYKGMRVRRFAFLRSVWPLRDFTPLI